MKRAGLLVTALLATPLAHAAPGVAIYGGGYTWDTELEGNVASGGANIDVQDDLGFNKADQNVPLPQSGATRLPRSVWRDQTHGMREASSLLQRPPKRPSLGSGATQRPPSRHRSYTRRPPQKASRGEGSSKQAIPCA